MGTPGSVIEQVMARVKAQQGLGADDIDNPFLQLIRQVKAANGGVLPLGGFLGSTVTSPTPIGTGRAFKVGIGEGLTDFLSIVGMDYEGIEPVTGGEKFAKGAGHLVGLLGAFVPFSYGTGFALRGIGLGVGEVAAGASVAEIALNARNAAVFRGAKNTLAFGLQEFGAGEDVREGVKKGFSAMAIAGGLEGMLAMRAIKGINTQRIAAEVSATKGAAKSSEYVVPPDLVAAARDTRILGTDDPQKITDLLIEIADDEKSYQMIAAEINRIYGTQKIITGITNPARFEAALKANDPLTEVHWSQIVEPLHGPAAPGRVIPGKGTYVATDGVPGTYEGLIWNPTHATRLERVAARDPRMRRPVRLLGEGEAIPIEDAHALFLTDVPGEMLPTPRLLRLSEDQMLKRTGQKGAAGATYFEHQTPSGEIELLVEMGGEKGAELELIVHEYSHPYLSVIDKPYSLVSGQRRPGTLREIFGDLAPASAPGIEPIDAMAGMTARNHPLVMELRKAQEEVVMIHAIGKGKPITRAQAQLGIASKASYYMKDGELGSYLFSLMLLDPKKAKAVAPMAVRFMTEEIQRRSPRLTSLLSRKGKSVFDAMGLRWREDAAGKKIWEILAPVKPSAKELKNWERWGFAKGQEVRYGTQEWVVENVVARGEGGAKLLDKIQIRHPRTGQRLTVDRNLIHRPTVPRLAEHTERVGKHLETVLNKRQNWLGFVLRNSDGTHQRGVVDLENYARALSFPAYLKANKAEIIAQAGKAAGIPISERGLTSIKDVRNAVMRHVQNSGKDGLVLEEGGIVTEVFNASQSGIIMGERLGEGFGLTVDNVGVLPRAGGGKDIARIVPSYRNRVTSILREEGVPDSQISWALDLSKKVSPKQMDGLLEDEVIQLRQGAQKAVDDAVRESVIRENIAQGISPAEGRTMPLDDMAAEVGLELDRTMTGQYRIKFPDGTPIAKVNTEIEAQGVLNRIGPDVNTPVLDEGMAHTTEAMGPGLASAKRKPFDAIPDDFEVARPELSKGRARLHGFRTSWLGKYVTMPEKHMQALEAKGFGPAWTKVWKPTKEATQALERWMNTRLWPALAGKKLPDLIKPIDKVVSRMKTERRRLVQFADEYLTKDQIAAKGGFLDNRPMNANELGASISARNAELGGGRFSDEIMTYLVRDGLVDEYVKSAKNFRIAVLPNLSDQAAKGQVDEATMMIAGKIDEAAKLAVDAEGNVTREALIESLGLSADEKEFWTMVSSWKAQHLDPKHEFNIFSVARHAGAPDEGIGAFVRLHGLSAVEQGVVRDRAQILDVIFAEEGLNRTHLMKANFPVVRKAADLGLSIDDPLFAVPEMAGVKSWVGARLRNGGLNPHNEEPYLTMMQHIRNVGAMKYVDPIMPEVEQWAAFVKAQDPGGSAAQLVDAYMSRIKSAGHDSFKTLQNGLQKMYSVATGGKYIPPKTAERLVSSLLAVGYSAAIPFRAAHVLRNGFQMQLSLPFLGGKHWGAGLSEAMTDKGFIETIKKGAIDGNLYPLVQSGEVFGVFPQGKTYGWMAEKYGEKFANAVLNSGETWEKVARVGFDWYKKPDDIGRAIAFWGTKSKLAEAWGVFESERGTLEALTKLKRTMKSHWYGEAVDTEFERLVTAGDMEVAGDFLGKELAKKTHFDYTKAATPYGWNSVQGKLGGQFGSFPVQFLDYMLETATGQTAPEAAAFWTYVAAMNAGVIVAGNSVGLDLRSWAIIPSLQYTGGPFADAGLSIANVLSGSRLERTLAINNLQHTFLPFEYDWANKKITFNNPESSFIPLSYAIGDVADAFGTNDLITGLLTGAGFNFIKK